MSYREEICYQKSMTDIKKKEKFQSCAPRPKSHPCSPHNFPKALFREVEITKPNSKVIFPLFMEEN
jgi:hypothetical protein